MYQQFQHLDIYPSFKIFQQVSASNYTHLRHPNWPSHDVQSNGPRVPRVFEPTNVFSKIPGGEFQVEVEEIRDLQMNIIDMWYKLNIYIYICIFLKHGVSYSCGCIHAMTTARDYNNYLYLHVISIGSVAVCSNLFNSWLYLYLFFFPKLQQDLTGKSASDLNHRKCAPYQLQVEL